MHLAVQASASAAGVRKCDLAAFLDRAGGSDAQERAFEVRWDRLLLLANCGDHAVSMPAPAGAPLWASGGPGEPWSVGWWLL